MSALKLGVHWTLFGNRCPEQCNHGTYTENLGNMQKVHYCPACEAGRRLRERDLKAGRPKCECRMCGEP